jgi:hypothetical protein
MTPLRFSFPKPPPPALLDALVEKLPYCTEEIASFRIDSQGVDLTVRDHEDARTVHDKVDRFYTRLARGFLPATAEVLIDDRRGDAPRTTLADLIGRRWILPFADGCIGLQGPALAVWEYIDNSLRAIGRQLGAADVRFPTLIEIDTLNACDYLASFPHHVTTAARLVGDADLIDAYAASVQTDRADALTSCAAPDHVLSPTVCIHCYRALRGRRLDKGELVRVTARGNCFRHELGRLDHGTRLWDFHMREIVFVGASDAVARGREQVVADVVGWLRELGLSFWIEGATDPFFVDRFSAQYFFQLAHKTKFELRMQVAETAMAVGSFNLHQGFFGTAFDITCGDDPAHTACVGFGLERLTYALLSQLGLDTSTWPTPLREAAQADARL